MVQKYKMPDGCEIVQLHEQPVKEQKRLMRQIFKLLQLNYGKFALSENPSKWLSRLYTPGKKGTTLFASVVLDKRGNVKSFASAERYDEKLGKGVVLITYTCGIKNDKNYANHIHAAKGGIHDALVDAQDSGLAINGVFQEHQIGNPGHRVKYEAGVALGQYPLSNQALTSVAGAKPFDNYIIPIFVGDVQKDATPEDIEKIKADAMPANLFIVGIMPTDQTLSLSEIIENLAVGYLDNNGYYADRPEKDPGYQSMINYADSFKIHVSYKAAHRAAGVNVNAALATPRVSSAPQPSPSA